MVTIAIVITILWAKCYFGMEYCAYVSGVSRAYNESEYLLTNFKKSQNGPCQVQSAAYAGTQASMVLECLE